MCNWESIESVEQLERQFPTESACAAFLTKLKWPQGFVCPRCSHHRAYLIQTRRLPLHQCSACGYQASITTGTIMEGSRTSLRKWLIALWLVSRSDAGINAVQLRSIIQVTYKTAWLILHKIRAIISHNDANSPLPGIVQGIVAFYGRSMLSPIQLHPKECPLIIAESVTGFSTHTGKLKMKKVDPKHCSKKLLLPIGCDHFATWFAENADETYINRFHIQVRRNSRLYQTFRQAWRWMNDTFHGIGSKYLQAYLDKYCFRYNASVEQACTMQRLLHLCMSIAIRPLLPDHSIDSLRSQPYNRKAA
ncbi:IS1595 family transposase [Paenibacillus thiaminolyticus]|uniref:IS1595 family transposase n=1 Tax=Paenibacillus thiaminolyticus TaxID=49283 RepID=UPI002543930A|nr:IS1595 family transposase [Paenibacillus thiaminolyticus]WII39768.1 IS1595 family transposase [Paenibacillus thiaminolyticus]